MIVFVRILLLLLSSFSYSDTVTRIIDTGGGLATVTRFSDGGVMVYDTGHWNHDELVATRITEFIGADARIDLLIASHSDSDHIAATDELFKHFEISRVIRTGMIRNTQTWRDHDRAIRVSAASGNTIDTNLKTDPIVHGTVFSFGESTVTLLAGFAEPPADWGLSGAEYRNGNSIVVKVSYQGNSILFTGDAIGRQAGAPAGSHAIATEKYLIDHANERAISSTVMIAPHHGGDNASSTDFIRAVRARWVIFAAGHAHKHPRAMTAERYLAQGYSPECMLRTDIGDDEGEKEWSFGRVTGLTDRSGDDGIEIILSDSGGAAVRYIGSSSINCPSFGGAPAVTSELLEPENTVMVIKKSRSGICHGPSSAWYSRTKRFISFLSMDDCLSSGGRLPN